MNPLKYLLLIFLGTKASSGRNQSLLEKSIRYRLKKTQIAIPKINSEKDVIAELFFELLMPNKQDPMGQYLNYDKSVYGKIREFSIF